MKYRSVNSGFGYVIRLERDEEIISSLKKFARSEKIGGAFFYGLGAFKNTKIGRRDDDAKAYVFEEHPEVMEVASLNGNISWKDENPVVHAHAVLSGEDLKAIGGHVDKAEVAITCEIFAHLQHGVSMERVYDEESDLDLLQFE